MSRNVALLRDNANVGHGLGTIENKIRKLRSICDAFGKRVAHSLHEISHG